MDNNNNYNTSIPIIKRKKEMKNPILIITIIILSLTPSIRAEGIRAIGAPYHTQEQVYNILKDMAASHPQNMNYETVGKSLMGKDLLLFKVGNLALCNETTKGKFMFDGKVHGSEDCGTENGIEFVRWALDSSEPEAIRVRNNNCLLFYPIVNIDTIQRQNLRKSYTAAEGGPLTVAKGVDLNRNAPTGFGATGSGNASNTYEYRGISGGSEPETQAYMNAMKKYRPNVYMNVHCGMQMLRYDQNTQTTQKILGLITNISTKKGVNTTGYYKPSQGCYGGYVCKEGSTWTGGNGWIHETSTWETLPATLTDYLSIWYPRAFPIYLAMAQAVEETNPPITTIPPVVTIDACEGVSCPDNCQGNQLFNHGNCINGSCTYNKIICQDGCNVNNCTTQDYICASDTYTCPDGSIVNRMLPDCQFETCQQERPDPVGWIKEQWNTPNGKMWIITISVFSIYVLSKRRRNSRK